MARTEVWEVEEQAEVTLTGDFRKLSPELSRYVTILSKGSFSELRLKTQEYAGLIPVTESLVLSVKPKAPVSDWPYLIMRARGKIREVRGRSPYDLARKRHPKVHDSILELMVVDLLAELDHLSRSGMWKDYRLFEHNGPRLSGRILQKQHLRRNILAGRWDRFLTGQYRQTDDIPENQFLKATLKHLLGLVNRGILGQSLRPRLARYCREFDDVTDRDLQELKLHFRSKSRTAANRFPPSRDYYRNLLLICLAIVDNLAILPGVQGQVSLSSFVIDMNWVFESFVRNVIHDALEGHSTLRVIDGNVETMALSPGAPGHMMKPDIVIYAQKQSPLPNSLVATVADAKYRTRAGAAEDMQQIISYLVATGAMYGVLIYPKMTGADQDKTISVAGRQIRIHYVDLASPNSAETEKRLVAALVETPPTALPLDDCLGVYLDNASNKVAQASEQLFGLQALKCSSCGTTTVLCMKDVIGFTATGVLVCPMCQCLKDATVCHVISKSANQQISLPLKWPRDRETLQEVEKELRQRYAWRIAEALAHSDDELAERLRAEVLDEIHNVTVRLMGSRHNDLDRMKRALETETFFHRPDLWNGPQGLRADSRDILAMAELIYQDYGSIPTADGAPGCIEFCRVLEIEIKQRLIDPLITSGATLSPFFRKAKNHTLGLLPGTYKRALLGEQPAVSDYSSYCSFVNTLRDPLMLTSFLPVNLTMINDSFRIPSAHKTFVPIASVLACRNLLLGTGSSPSLLISFLEATIPK